MANRQTIMAGVWECIVAEWNAGNLERARSLERFFSALEARIEPDSADEAERAEADI